MGKTGSHQTESPAAGVDRTQTLAPKTGSNDSGRDTVAVDPTVRASATPPSGERTAAVILPTDDPERYHPAGEHARGGLGRVVRAHDTRLGRTVAVKELLRNSPQAEALFVREALITAKLQHPGIVPVHEAGRWPSGDPYYVMKLVQGRTLKEVIAERATLAERIALLPHAIAVAEAIGYAHSNGVIHRDIKPANVMVGDFGETVVVDWGLARDHRREPADQDGAMWARPPTSGSTSTSGERTSTVSGRVIGTPQYMPPEQARGEIVDERADVYSLGALCYELLAGRAPYAGSAAQAILDAVLAGPPRRLAEVAGGVPRDLDAIVGKAMARDPAHRYANGKELAEDLKRFQSGQLVSAQTYGAVSLARRWIDRNRGPVAATAVAGVVVLALAIYAFTRVVDERNVARAATAQTRVALGAAENRQHQLTLLQAHRSLAQDPTAVIAWLKAYPSELLVDAEIPAMIDEAVAGGVARHVWRQRDWVYGTAFSPDGRRVATASKDGDVRLYDVASGAMQIVGRHPPGLMSVAFAPDGKTLATGGVDGEIALWDLGTGVTRKIGQQPESVGELRYSADGARLLSGGEGGPPRVWDAMKGGGRVLLSVDDIVMMVAVPEDDWSRALAASANGSIWRAGAEGAAPTKIATIAGGVAGLGASRDGAIAIASDGKLLWRIDVDQGTVTRLGAAPPMIKSIAFTRDGLEAAVGGADLDIVLVDLRANTTRTLRGHTDSIYDLHFSRDGRRLLSASDDGTARVWDLGNGAARILRGHTDDVIRAAWSPAEDLVATASLDGSARLWPLDRKEIAIWGGDLGSVEKLMRVDGGTRVVALSVPGRATAFDVATGARTDLLTGDLGHTSYSTPRLPGVSPDGHWVGVAREDGTIAVWHDGVGPALKKGHTGWITDGVFAPDSSVVYTAASDLTVRAWDLASGTNRVVYKGDTAWGLAVSPDSKLLAIGTGERIVLVDRDGNQRASTHAFAPPSKFCSRGLQFDAAGDRLLAGRCDGSVLVWSPAHGAPVALQTSHGYNVAVVFSPDGTRIAGAMADRTVRVWDSATGKLVATLGGHTDLVMAVAFSPDGHRLASASYDRTIRVWDPATGASRVLRGHDGSVDALQWTPDGARLISGSRDGTVRLWAAPSLAPPHADAVRATLKNVTSAVIAVDDRPATPSDTTPGG